MAGISEGSYKYRRIYSEDYSSN